MQNGDEISGLRTRLQDIGHRVTECSNQMQKLRAEISYLALEMADATTRLNFVEGGADGESGGEMVGIGLHQ